MGGHHDGVVRPPPPGDSRSCTHGTAGGGRRRFITGGALLSVLLGAGVEAHGLQLVVMGLAFRAGFFFVVLFEAVLFTEANVVRRPRCWRAQTRACGSCAFGRWQCSANLARALLVGGLAAFGQDYPSQPIALLAELVESKMRYRDDGSAAAWLRAVSSGMLANWLVGMAAFFAFMGRTIIGKYIPVGLAVTMFVAAGFQDSLANMGYFALHMAQGQGPGWDPALWWNIVPAGLGNMLGGALLVALPFWYAFRPSTTLSPTTPETGRPET